ncbi:MAG: hypothetical protein WAQ08_04795 [Aquabacterium sp.]|uniref:hypothetical protein n=1 Tax=Aquabacterium sp. TaxID=1872578 RepID=UPI003BB0F67B
MDKGAQGPASAQLQGLEELRSQARALLKVHKGDNALDSRLADLEVGAKKRVAALEKAAPSAAPAEAEEDEAGAALADPKRLLQQLTMCRKDPDRKVQFAYVDGKDKAPGVLTLSPKATGSKLFALLAEHTGSKQGTFGTAWVDGDDLVLQLDKPLGGLLKKLRTPVKASGFKVSQIVLMSEDGTVFEKGAEVQEAPTASSIPPAPPLPPAGKVAPAPTTAKPAAPMARPRGCWPARRASFCARAIWPRPMNWWHRPASRRRPVCRPRCSIPRPAWHGMACASTSRPNCARSSRRC